MGKKNGARLLARDATADRGALDRLLRRKPVKSSDHATGVSDGVDHRGSEQITQCRPLVSSLDAAETVLVWIQERLPVQPQAVSA